MHDRPRTRAPQHTLPRTAKETLMTNDNFNDAAHESAASKYQGDWDPFEGDPVDDWGVSEAERRAHVAGWEAARAYLAAQEPTDAAQIIDEHRTTGRWVGDGVRVECTCGHISPGSHPGGPQTAEDNAHRDADRKHAAHVADMLARAARRDGEAR